MTNTIKVDVLNFFLIWTTLIVAFIFPFELFLFSYAVLGPLHYMTEMNWLDKKNYFLNNQKDKTSYLIVSIVIISLMTVGFLFKEYLGLDFSKLTYEHTDHTSDLGTYSNLTLWSYSILFVGLIMSIIYILTNRWLNRILLLCISLLITILFFNFPVFAIWFGLFLPTIIHVFIFTLFFMWIGALRSKSKWGYLNVLSLIAVILIIINKEVSPISGSVDNTTFSTFTTSNFQNLIIAINKYLGLVQGKTLDIYSPNIWKIQVFIAFAYTYHYLNWFSKTTVINWHKTDKNKMVAIIVLWIFSLVLYYLNYHLGFVALYVLSMLHVILEFPLNIGSIKGVIQTIFNRKDKLITSSLPVKQ